MRGRRDLLNGVGMLAREILLQFRCIISLRILQNWYREFFPTIFHDFLLKLLKDLPHLDIMSISGNHLHVLALSLEPINVNDGFIDVHTSQGIEFSEVGLVLGEVIELVGVFGVGVGLLKDDDSSCAVAEGDVLSFTIEFQTGYDVFLLDWLVWTFVAEYLREFERRCLGGALFFHDKSSILYGS